jgi:hypothetical protein
MREYSPFEGGIFMMGVPSSSVGALLWEVHLKQLKNNAEQNCLFIFQLAEQLCLIQKSKSNKIT